MTAESKKSGIETWGSAGEGMKYDGVTVRGQGFSELKNPYNTVAVVDFSDLECEVSAKSVAVCARRGQ